MIEFQTHSCPACKEQFVVACEQELQEKLEAHLEHCVAKTQRKNKKRERSKQLQEQRIALYVHDITINRLEEHNFDKLVKQGVFVHG